MCDYFCQSPYSTPHVDLKTTDTFGRKLLMSVKNNDHDLVEIYTGSTCNIALHATSDCLLCTQHIYSALFTEERRCAKAGERINWSARYAHYIFPGNDS